MLKISGLSLKKKFIPFLACSSILSFASIFNLSSTHPAFAQQPSSYQRSCKDISVKGNRLSALCRTRRGSYRNTSILIRGIQNINGILKYEGDKEANSSYQRTCRRIVVRGNRLSALCRTRRGSYRNTSLTILGIENINGRLKYTQNINGSAVSSYQKTCRRIVVRGNRLSALCRTRRGSYRNTSILIRGIQNIDGILKYEGDKEANSSYQRTCRRIVVRGNRLSALCRTRRGSYRNTSLTILGIENINGRLKYTS